MSKNFLADRLGDLTKLEQCVLLIDTVDRDNGTVTLSITMDGEGFSIDVGTSCLSSKVIANGHTLDEAATKLHAELTKRTSQMRKTLAVFDVEKSQ